MQSCADVGGRRMKLAMYAQTRKAVLEAETVLLEPVGLAVRLQRVWRLVRGSRASAKLDAGFEGDRLDGPRVECDGDDDFARVTSEIGEQLVRKLDEGCVPEAFAAWCSVFMDEFEVLKGRDGGEWTLLGELNFDAQPRSNAARDEA